MSIIYKMACNHDSNRAARYRPTACKSPVNKVIHDNKSPRHEQCFRFVDQAKPKPIMCFVSAQRIQVPMQLAGFFSKTA
jgi:hypothetical protein